MRWLRRPKPAPETGGREALEHSKQALEKTRAETPYYERMHREARVLLAENNIAAKVVAAISGGSGR